MPKTIAVPRVRFAALTGLLCISAAQADTQVLDLFIGKWDIHAKTLQPAPSTADYSETYTRVLDGHFIRGQTGRKADGSYDIVFGTYDKNADGYPFWIFSSAGGYTYLPPATWNARERVMTWENPRDWDINYFSRCHFPDRKQRDCHLIMKDWKGKVILELEWQAIRRPD